MPNSGKIVPDYLHADKEGVRGYSKRTSNRKIQELVDAELSGIYCSVLERPCPMIVDSMSSCSKASNVGTLDDSCKSDDVWNVCEPDLNLVDSVEDCSVSGSDILSDSSSCNSSSCSLVDESTSECSDYEYPESPDRSAPSCLKQLHSQGEDALRRSIREWAVLCNVPNSTLKKLLKILKPSHPGLPLHPDTLHLNSGPLEGITKMGNGEFFYFGGKERLEEMAVSQSQPFTFKLSFNVDGLPIFKSTTAEFWPIMCTVEGLAYPPFVWAAWCGSGKPPLQEYFKQFVPDMNYLVQNGISYQGSQFPVQIKCFVCDAPALAFVRATLGHGGFHGCGKCSVVGEHISCMTFPTSVGPLRTDQSFLEQDDPDFHKGYSPLLDLNIGMITCFPLDYLHLVCLGVVKRMLKKFLKSKVKLNWKRILSDEAIERVNGKIALASMTWARDFSRSPRSLQHLSRWTATEFRQFLLYLGPVVFRGSVIEKKPIYDLFLLLHYGITILMRKDLNPSLLNDAESALKRFVKRSKRLLGKDFVSYNVHNLLHLTQDCRVFGVLDNFSAFPFENELQVLKHAVRGKRKPLHQLVKRIKERDRLSMLRMRFQSVPDGLIAGRANRRKKSPSPIFTKAQWKGRTISTLRGDNFVAVGDKVVCIKHFIVKNGEPYAVGKQFLSKKNLYKFPEKSSRIGIYLVSNLGHALSCWKLRDVQCKLAPVALDDKQFAVFPLIN